MRRGSKEEIRHLWTAVAIALALAAYRIAVECVDWLRVTFQPYTRLPVAEVVTNGLFLWLLALLYYAYRQWRTAVYREHELEVVISSISPDVLMVVSPDRRISMCNAGVSAMFGYEVDEVLGQTTELLYFDRRTGSNPHEIRDCLQRIGFHIGAAKGRRRNGEVFPLEIITGNLRGGPGAVVLLRDITERRRMEEQLVRAKEDLEQNFRRLQELEHLRDSLTHMIVHDLKSPLSTVGGLLGVLGEETRGRIDADQAGYLAECSRLVQRLQDMILSLLDVSRLEKGQLPLNLAPQDVAALARDAERMARGQSSGAAVVIVPPAAPAVARCDGEIVQRVLVNLLDNALKFTPADGEVRVRFEREGNRVRVTVLDTGAGIPAEFHQKVFERFAQVQARKFSTGLGLTFCKLAVEAHGGTIAVESPVAAWKAERPGVVGTAFTFTLPAEAGQGS